jgi:hypothetical protein
MGLAFAVPAGGGTLFVLGLTIAVAELVGGGWLVMKLRRRLACGGTPLLRPLLRTVTASMLMAGPAYLIAVELPALLPTGGGRIPIVAAIVAGSAVFLVVHALWRSPELALLAAGLRQLKTSPRPRRSAPAPTGAAPGPTPTNRRMDRSAT